MPEDLARDSEYRDKGLGCSLVQEKARPGLGTNHRAPLMRGEMKKNTGILIAVAALAALLLFMFTRKKSTTPGTPVPVEIALASLIATGHLVQVSQLNPDTGLFEAFVPGLPGNTLIVVRPNIPIFINMSMSHTITSSGVSYFIPANTPTEVAVGATVDIRLVL